MSGGRGSYSISTWHRIGNLGRPAVSRLLLGIGLLMLWTIAFGALVEEVAATGRAARGEGVPGTFTAQSEACGKSGCSWYGTFTTGGPSPQAGERVQLRGDGDRPVHAGESVPALDVGSGSFVHMRGGSPEWGEPVGAGVVAALAGVSGAALNAKVVWDVLRARAAPAPRRRQERKRGRPAPRDLADRDRWGPPVRSGSAGIRVRMARSKRRTLAGTACLLALVAMLLLFGLYWADEETTAAELVAGSWAPLFAAVLAGVTVQTLRLVLLRPRMRVTEDEIVIRDPLLLRKALRIPRAAIAAIHYGDEPGRRADEDTVRLTPFREELNLVLRLRYDISLPVRRLRWGNWFWVMLTLNGLDPVPAIPRRVRRFRLLRLRVKEPRRAATDLDRWLGEGQAPPAPAPVEDADSGTPRTHRGVGDARIKIKGRMPRPVLAEFEHEGPGTLRAWLRRGEFGRGTPVVECGPGAPPARAVLDDRTISGKALTKRFLHVESEGRWTVTISGPERAPTFTRSATGSGPEVLGYRGPAGIAVLTCPPGRQPHQIHLHGPDLAALHGCDPVVSGTPQRDGSPPNRCTFAVPAQAVLQVRSAAADWRIDVTPLEHADVDAPARGAPVPPTGRVRPFEHSIAGDRAAVVRYLGPPGPVLFRSGDAFGLLHLDAALTPVRTLASPGGDTEIRLHSHTLLQVTGNHPGSRAEAAWSLEETHQE